METNESRSTKEHSQRSQALEGARSSPVSQQHKSPAKAAAMEGLRSMEAGVSNISEASQDSNSNSSNSQLASNDATLEGDILQTETELRKLCFRNPGKFMEDFDPEKSARELRKIKRRMCLDKMRRNQMYNEQGRLLENSEDWCDCLEIECSGCHFPCPKCSSNKCGNVCRSNRCWFYEVVEVEGMDKAYMWPTQPSPLY